MSKKENGVGKGVIGTIVVIVVLLITGYLYINRNKDGTTPVSTDQFNNRLDNLEIIVDENFQLQQIEFDKIQIETGLIIDSLHTVILYLEDITTVVNKTGVVLEKVNYKTDILMYGNNAIYKEITGMELPQFNK